MDLNRAGLVLFAVDVQYLNDSAYTAGVMFESWKSETPSFEYTGYLKRVAPYKSGNFYKRELPCILDIIEKNSLKPDVIIIDGCVYLDRKNSPGLGKHLYDSLSHHAEIIGVAKNSLPGLGSKHALLRGGSKRPLYITTTGDLEVAKESIKLMYGNNRIPTLLRRADQLCREEANKSMISLA